MRAVAAVMVLVGAVLGYGAALEFRYFGPDASQFWVGVFTTPAALFFLLAGARLWTRGLQARRMVVAASLAMAAATLGATLLRVMGPPATLLGFLGVLTAFTWAGRRRTAVPTPRPDQ
jgi:hypothetical protein